MVVTSEHLKDPPKLDRLCARIHEISTLPQVAIRVMEVANDPHSSALDLKEVMETDASLCARVLKSVNSSAYGLRQKVTNLQHAIAFLGAKEIRNLAVTASVSRLFQQGHTIGPYDREALWRHFVAVGICSRLVAMRLGMKSFEDIFLGGLLHDIGIVLEDQHVHNHFEAIIGSVEDGSRLVQIETSILGFDHVRLGAQVAESWGFPKGIVDAIRHHHDSRRYSGDYIQMVRCVEVANFMCSMKGITSIGKQCVEFPRHAIDVLSLKKEDFLVLVEDLDTAFRERNDLFAIR